MRRIYTLALLTVMFCQVALAQQSRIEIISSSPEKTVLKVTVNGFDWKTVQTEEGAAKVISLENGVQVEKTGQPDLPMLTVMVPAPNGELMIFTNATNQHMDFENMNVAYYNGSKPNLRKYDDELFNGFYPRIPFYMHEPVIIDGERMVMLNIYPVQYNTDLKAIRLHNDIEVTIQQQNGNCKSVTQSLAVNEAKPSVGELSVYPNPTLDLLTVGYDLQSESEVTLDVYNHCGQMVYSKNKGVQAACKQTATLDVSGFAPGMYSLALHTDKGTAIKRVVVE